MRVSASHQEHGSYYNGLRDCDVGRLADHFYHSVHQGSHGRGHEHPHDSFGFRNIEFTLLFDLHYFQLIGQLIFYIRAGKLCFMVSL